MKSKRLSRFVLPCLLVLFGSVLSVSVESAETASVVTHGPLLGEVTSSSVRIWARTNGPGTIEFHFGKDPASLHGVSEKIETTAAHDFTGWTTLHGLDPDAEYVASVFIDGNPAGVPATFHTLPDSNALRDQKHNPRGLFNFSFTFGSCANQNPLHGIGPSLPTYATFLDNHADEVDFQIMNGDWLYE